MVLFASTNGYADKVPVESVRAWEADLLRYLDSLHPEIGRDIMQRKMITPENDAKLREAIQAFNNTWTGA